LVHAEIVASSFRRNERSSKVERHSVARAPAAESAGNLVAACKSPQFADTVDIHSHRIFGYDRARAESSTRARWNLSDQLPPGNSQGADLKEAAPDGARTPPSASHSLTYYRGTTMDTVNGKSNAPSGENQNASDAPSDVSAETPPRTPLQQRIETQRMQLLQAHSVLVCLYEVLLHADGEDAVVYAEAAHVAAHLVSNSVEELDSVRLYAA
jgi:hypothetical protein